MSHLRPLFCHTLERYRHAQSPRRASARRGEAPLVPGIIITSFAPTCVVTLLYIQAPSQQGALGEVVFCIFPNGSRTKGADVVLCCNLTFASTVRVAFRVYRHSYSFVQRN